MKIWCLRIEFNGQLVEEVNFDSFEQANEYIIQDKQYREDPSSTFVNKMSYFLEQKNI